MRSLLLLLSAICLQLSWSYGEPVSASKGVGSFAYQDSTGKRYRRSLLPWRPFGLLRNSFGTGFGSGYGNRFGSGFGGAGHGFPTGFQNRFGGVQSSNSATAAAAAAPGFTAHFASINPSNPTIPNVNVVNRFAETGKDGNKGGPGFYTVSSTSYSTSANMNGKEVSSRGAETVVNNNGEVTKYAVHS